MNRKGMLNLPSAMKKPSIRAETEKRKTIQIEHFRLVDELLLLQHVIRRFKLHHEADFTKLLELRRQLSERLLIVLPKKSVAFEELHAKSLWCCMGVLDSRENLTKIEQNGMDWLISLLAKDLENILDSHTFKRVKKKDIVSLARIIFEFSADIVDINRRLNYTQYFSILGLTSFIPGQKFYSHYINAKFGKHHFTRNVTNPRVDVAALWMFSEDTYRDDDFSILIKTDCGAPIKISKNIQMFGGQQHSISVNNTVVKNRLILCVPTDEAPDRIDDALRKFRAALIQEFDDNCSEYFSIANVGFRNSIFMTQTNHEVCLIKDWDQVQSHIVGLWSWDISRQLKCTKEVANEQVGVELEKIQKELELEDVIYSDVSIEAHRDKTNSLIGPSIDKLQKKPTIIDRFITRNSDILGAIQISNSAD